MPLMNWSDALDVGVSAMNEEHKVLLSLMNRLYDENAAKKGHAAMVRTFVELERKVHEHFADEERFMTSIRYEGLDSHKMIHRSLEASLAQHREAFVASGADHIEDAIFRFLKLWLSAHIQGIDTKYGKVARGRAA